MKEMEKQKLGSEPISKLLLKMSVPMILAMVINGMYYLADAIFVGWGVGSEALGGLAIIFPLQIASNCHRNGYRYRNSFY